MKHQTKLLLAISGAIGAYWLGRSLLRTSRHFEFAGKVALITGGTRGLGLSIARQLVHAGTRVAICARTEADVDVAVEELTQAGGNVIGMVCDVRDRAQVKAFVDCVLTEWKRVDLLFNVAGIMEVGPLDNMTIDDFYDSMDVNCWGALHASLAVLPAMRQQNWGRIVNVASIGGKQAVPHLLPYTASKHALVGLSNGLRVELIKEGILVTTVCPTLMRTGSPRNASFKGQHQAEFAWFDIAGSLPIVSIDAQRAANQILDACQNGDAEVYITNFLNPAVWAVRCSPEFTAAALAIVHRLLPGPGGIRENSAYGYQSESRLAPSLLTTMNDRAAIENNEMGTRTAASPFHHS